jgi:hypothetical protein
MNNKRTLQETATVTAVQSFTVKALFLCALAVLTVACGSGGGGSGTAAGVNNNQGLVEVNYLTVTSDDYGLLTPNFYYSINNNAMWSIQSSLATDIGDPNFRSIIRIDIPKNHGVMPAINKPFSIEDNGQFEKFPGTFSVFNGQASVLKKVEQGVIVFTANSNPSGAVAGMFNITLTDYDASLNSPPQYHIIGMFRFRMGTYGPADPL